LTGDVGRGCGDASRALLLFLFADFYSPKKVRRAVRRTGLVSFQVKRS
jgi:hypothetical protein